jgi:hypothetical protein
MTIEYIESLEYTTEMEREIKELIIKNVNNKNSVENAIITIAEKGIDIDTVSFFTRYKEDINEAIFELLECWGAENVIELFSGYFDEKDYLCLKEHNQKLIVNFIIKETCASIHESWEFKKEAA